MDEITKLERKNIILYDAVADYLVILYDTNIINRNSTLLQQLNNLIIHNMKTRETIKTSLMPNGIRQITISPNGKYIAFCGNILIIIRMNDLMVMCSYNDEHKYLFGKWYSDDIFYYIDSCGNDYYSDNYMCCLDVSKHEILIKMVLTIHTPYRCRYAMYDNKLYVCDIYDNKVICLPDQTYIDIKSIRSENQMIYDCDNKYYLKLDSHTLQEIKSLEPLTFGKTFKFPVPVFSCIWHIADNKKFHSRFKYSVNENEFMCIIHHLDDNKRLTYDYSLTSNSHASFKLCGTNFVHKIDNTIAYFNPDRLHSPIMSFLNNITLPPELMNIIGMYL